MKSQSTTKKLEPQQVLAAAGPVDQNTVEMLTYMCKGCGGKFPDMGHYFYGVNSVRCIWCSKFPKAKNERQIK